MLLQGSVPVAADYSRASLSFSSLRFMSISAFGPARQMLLCSESRVSHEYACISFKHLRTVCLSDNLNGKSLSLNWPVRTICSRAAFQASSRSVIVVHRSLRRLQI
jgi:hypothetical protein